MKLSSVLTIFYCTSIVMMSILFHGCAQKTQTLTTQLEPRVTTETHTVAEQRVKNPETGPYEMMVVSEEQARTVPSVTGDNVFDPPRRPNAHTKHGHSNVTMRWYFYTLGLLLAGFYLANN